MLQHLSERLARLAKSLEGSKAAVSLPIKMKTAEVIMGLMSPKKRFGLLVILGWKRNWQKYLDIPDSDQDIFAEHRLDVMELRHDRQRRFDVGATVEFDGAILIDTRGIIIHSGVVIEGMRPRVVAAKLHPGRFKDLSEQFGFDTKVHTRHLTAIAASYVFKGTTVFTVSEETGAFHAYEYGRIVHHEKE